VSANQRRSINEGLYHIAAVQHQQRGIIIELLTRIAEGMEELVGLARCNSPPNHNFSGKPGKEAPRPDE
jgi:hypothetical protein